MKRIDELPNIDGNTLSDDDPKLRVTLQAA